MEKYYQTKSLGDEMNFRPVCNYCEKIIQEGENWRRVFHEPVKGIVGQFHERCLGKEIARNFGVELKNN